MKKLFILCFILFVSPVCYGAYQEISDGESGLSVRTKINEQHQEIYNTKADKTGTDPIVAASFTATKTTGVPGYSYVQEAEADSNLTTGFQGADNQSVNISYKFPDSVGTANQVLSQGTPLTGQTLPNGETGTIVPLSWVDSGSGAGGYVSPPTYSDDTCTTGQYSFDTSYWYACESTDQWDRYAVTWTNWSNPTPTLPTLTSATIPTNGTQVDLVFSEALTAGAGGNGGWTLNTPTNAMTYSSGDGTANWTYTLASTINSTDNPTISYTQPGDGFEDSTGDDLASIVAGSVTNNSTQGGGLACITSGGDILQETFNTDPGYDDSNWTEDPNNPDEDNTTLLNNSPCFSNQYLYCTGNDQWARNTFASTQAQVYISFYIHITAESISSGNNVTIARIEGPEINMRLNDSSGALTLTLVRASQIGTATTVNLGEQYLIQIFVDNTNDLVSMYVYDRDEVLINSFVDVSDTMTSDISGMILGPVNNSVSSSMYFDNIDVNSTGWPTGSPSK